MIRDPCGRGECGPIVPPTIVLPDTVCPIRHRAAPTPLRRFSVPLRILLANSRQGWFGRNMGKEGRIGKANPRLQTPRTNSPTVSIADTVDEFVSVSGNFGFALPARLILPNFRQNHPW